MFWKIFVFCLRGTINEWASRWTRLTKPMRQAKNLRRVLINPKTKTYCRFGAAAWKILAQSRLIRWKGEFLQLLHPCSCLKRIFSKRHREWCGNRAFCRIARTKQWTCGDIVCDFFQMIFFVLSKRPLRARILFLFEPVLVNSLSVWFLMPC